MKVYEGEGVHHEYEDVLVELVKVRMWEKWV